MNLPQITYLLGSRELYYVRCGGLLVTVACSVSLAEHGLIIGGPTLHGLARVYGQYRSHVCGIKVNHSLIFNWAGRSLIFWYMYQELHKRYAWILYNHVLIYSLSIAMLSYQWKINIICKTSQAVDLWLTLLWFLWTANTNCFDSIRMELLPLIIIIPLRIISPLLYVLQKIAVSRDIHRVL